MTAAVPTGNGAPAATGAAAQPDWLLTGGTLRGLLAIAAILLWAVTLAGTTARASAVVLAAIAAGVATLVRHPGSPVALVLCGAAVLTHLARGPADPLGLAAAASLLHTVHTLAAASEVVPRHAPVDGSLVRPIVGRWLVTQAVTVPTVLAVATLLR